MFCLKKNILIQLLFLNSINHAGFFGFSNYKNSAPLSLNFATSYKDLTISESQWENVFQRIFNDYIPQGAKQEKFNNIGLIQHDFLIFEELISAAATLSLYDQSSFTDYDKSMSAHTIKSLLLKYKTAFKKYNFIRRSYESMSPAQRFRGVIVINALDKKHHNKNIFLKQLLYNSINKAYEINNDSLVNMLQEVYFAPVYSNVNNITKSITHAALQMRFMYSYNDKKNEIIAPDIMIDIWNSSNGVTADFWFQLNKYQFDVKQQKKIYDFFSSDTYQQWALVISVVVNLNNVPSIVPLGLVKLNSLDFPYVFQYLDYKDKEIVQSFENDDWIENVHDMIKVIDNPLPENVNYNISVGDSSQDVEIIQNYFNVLSSFFNYRSNKIGNDISMFFGSNQWKMDNLWKISYRIILKSFKNIIKKSYIKKSDIASKKIFLSIFNNKNINNGNYRPLLSEITFIGMEN